ncbi:MAG: hypothetical protein AAGA83_14545 [Cyanobacteria bacterium P01_F01_bin.116]
MSKRKIENLLRKALLEGGEMVHGLYEFELQEHIDYWYQGLLRDKDEFLFVVTENNGDVAMILIMPDKTLYVNEEALEELRQLWPVAHKSNLKRLIPRMADQLSRDIIAVNGVKTEDSGKHESNGTKSS